MRMRRCMWMRSVMPMRRMCLRTRCSISRAAATVPPSAPPSASPARSLRALSGVSACVRGGLRFGGFRFRRLRLAALVRCRLRISRVACFRAAIFLGALRLRGDCHWLGAFRNGRAKSRQRLDSFLPPVRAAETLRRNGVPAHGFFAAPGVFFDRAGFERYHRVARFLKQFIQFASGIRARTRPAYSSLYLPPVSHVRDCISANARNASGALISHSRCTEMKLANTWTPKLLHHSSMLDLSATEQLCERARAIGFELCGVAPAAEFEELRNFPEWLERGYAGEMHYLHDPRRKNLRETFSGVRSVIVCAMNYNSAPPHSTSVSALAANGASPNSAASGGGDSPRGWISRYAWGSDYHDVLEPRLEALIAWMRAEFGPDFFARAYVDTGPVLERVAAKHAGLGWLAKNTCLINQQSGSWLFLGVILTDLEFAPSLANAAAPPRDLCGRCTRCIDACPTNAFAAPYVLDARRCIAYLTIELRGSLPEEFRPAMGSHVFGCDICQDVCPWNRKAPVTVVPEFQPRKIPHAPNGEASDADAAEISLFHPSLGWLLSLSEEEFRAAFRGSPVKRTKWRGLVRNACVAIGNSGITPANPSYSRIMHRLEALARGGDALLAEHAQWALDRLRENFSTGQEPATRARKF